MRKEYGERPECLEALDGFRNEKAWAWLVPREPLEAEEENPEAANVQNLDVFQRVQDTLLRTKSGATKRHLSARAPNSSSEKIACAELMPASNRTQ